MQECFYNNSVCVTTKLLMSSEICQSTRVSLFYTATTALPSSPEYNFEEPAWWPHYNGEPLQWCCEETTADGSCAGDLTRC